MIEDIRKLLDQYINWLREKTVLHELDGEWVEITTPYLDRHNDYLQIYTRRNENGFLLTDDGSIVQDLVESGCSLDSPKRQALLNMTLAGFGIKNNIGRLEVQANEHNFALRKHNLLQAMLAVNDLFYAAKPHVKSLFREDVESWLSIHQIRYTPRVKFNGKSGLDYQFDFVIPTPERIVQTITRPSTDTAKMMAFSWLDTKETRSGESSAFAILNDSEHDISDQVSDILRSYDVVPVAWSKRDDVIERLAA